MSIKFTTTTTTKPRQLSRIFLFGRYKIKYFLFFLFSRKTLYGLAIEGDKIKYYVELTEALTKIVILADFGGGARD